MAWWDYGYWIEDLARRVPVTNPTQTNAGVAAELFLSHSEKEAIPLLKKWRTRYVVVDAALPLWPADAKIMLGAYPAFFEFTGKYRRNDYLLTAGEPTPKVFYLPAYYRSLVVRLFVFGGKAVDGRGGATILFLRPNQELAGTKRFDSAQDALAAEAACRNEGCVLAGDNPMVSCVALEPLEHFRPLFSSTTSIIGFGSTARKAVQVYEFTPEKW